MCLLFPACENNSSMSRGHDVVLPLFRTYILPPLQSKTFTRGQEGAESLVVVVQGTQHSAELLCRNDSAVDIINSIHEVVSLIHNHNVALQTHSQGLSRLLRSCRHVHGRQQTLMILMFTSMRMVSLKSQGQHGSESARA